MDRMEATSMLHQTRTQKETHHLARSLNKVTRALGKARTIANAFRAETVHCGKG